MINLTYIRTDAWYTVVSRIASQWRGITVKLESRAFQSVIVKYNGVRIGRIKVIGDTVLFDSDSHCRYFWNTASSLYDAFEQLVDLEIGF